MSRQYRVQPTMFVPQYPTYDEGIVAPDAKLVAQLHRLLDMIPHDNLATSIDMTVSDLLRFHQPAYQGRGTAILMGSEQNDKRTNA
jgi:hypothetical protein